MTQLSLLISVDCCGELSLYHAENAVSVTRDTIAYRGAESGKNRRERERRRRVAMIAQHGANRNRWASGKDA